MKELMNLKDISKLVDIPARRIQFYINQGLLKPASTARSRGVAHGFSKVNVLELKIILLLVSYGFHLDKIKEFLRGISSYLNDVLTAPSRGEYEVYLLKILKTNTYSLPQCDLYSTEELERESNILIKELRTKKISFYALINLADLVEKLKV